MSISVLVAFALGAFLCFATLGRFFFALLDEDEAFPGESQRAPSVSDREVSAELDGRNLLRLPRSREELVRLPCRCVLSPPAPDGARSLVYECPRCRALLRLATGVRLAPGVAFTPTVRCAVCGSVGVAARLHDGRTVFACSTCDAI